MTERTEWTGTASDLLDALAEVAGERVAKSKSWPDSPRALSGRLRRAVTFLRKIGLEVAFDREGRARTRVIRISVAPAESKENFASASSASSEAHKANDLARTHMRTQNQDADATVRSSPLIANDTDDADGMDAKSAPYSADVGTDISGEPSVWRGRL
jgi:hypothetical protein